MNGRRLLLVHAHPDDETINNGATMAKYAAEGRGVTLVTCTAGERGEILVPELEHLAADRDGGLAEQRKGEIADAMAALGVTDHRWLGVGYQAFFRPQFADAQGIYRYGGIAAEAGSGTAVRTMSLPSPPL